MEIGGYCARQAEQSFWYCEVETQFIDLYYFNSVSSMKISGKPKTGYWGSTFPTLKRNQMEQI